MKKTINSLCILLLLFSAGFLKAQQQDRFTLIEERLSALASQNPGLNEKVDFSVSGASIQEFLRGLAESNNLNISVDPSLNIKIYNNFTNEKVSTIILFLAREYDLDIRFVGSIMSFYKYQPLIEVVKLIPKEINVKYNSYNNTLTLELKNDSLESVAKRITQVSKKNIILSSDLSGKRVSVYIENMPFDNAMEKMAFANDLKVTKTEDDFYLIQPVSLDEKNILANKGTPNNKNKRNNRPSNSSGQVSPENMFVEVKDTLNKKLITADITNGAISDALKAVAEEMGINYFLFSEVKGNTTLKVQDADFNGFLTYLFQGTDYTYKIDKGLYLIGDRKLEGLRANKVFQFQYRSLDAVNEIIPTELKKGVEIKEFKELNSILLTGSQPQIQEIEAFLKQLDRIVPMVLIEVILVDIRKGRTVKTGIRAGVSDSTKAGGSIFPGIDFNFSTRSINNFLAKISGGPVNLGRVGPNFYFGLSALENNNNVEVRSMPKLSTLNGHEANLSIGSTRYYSISTQNVLGSLQPQTVVTQQFNAVQANLAINIKPVVAGDDQVTLNIDVNITDFIGDPPASGPPPSATSQFKSIIRVKNDEMVVLGGLERTEKSEQGAGIPLLSRIPVLKWIFSSKTKSKNKTVSIVFIKPTIIY